MVQKTFEINQRPSLATGAAEQFIERERKTAIVNRSRKFLFFEYRANPIKLNLVKRV
jgi:hypothetical protein